MPNADHRSSENATQAELARIAERRTRPAQPSHTRIVVGELSSCTGSPMLLGRWALVSIALSATFSTTMSISSDLATPSFPPAEEDVSECLLLFGAYANGNLGDIVQSSTMARLMSNVASADTCIWHAHPSKESTAKGFREGTKRTERDRVERPIVAVCSLHGQQPPRGSRQSRTYCCRPQWLSLSCVKRMWCTLPLPNLRGIFRRQFCRPGVSGLRSGKRRAGEGGGEEPLVFIVQLNTSLSRVRDIIWRHLVVGRLCI